VKSKGPRNGTKPTNLNPAIELLCKTVWRRQVEMGGQDGIPPNPDVVYKDTWKGWADFMGWSQQSRRLEIMVGFCPVDVTPSQYVEIMSALCKDYVLAKVNA